MPMPIYSIPIKSVIKMHHKNKVNFKRMLNCVINSVVY